MRICRRSLSLVFVIVTTGCSCFGQRSNLKMSHWTPAITFIFSTSLITFPIRPVKLDISRENGTAAPTLKESCIMGSTWTWASFQLVVIRCLTLSDSRQHMVLYLSLERHTFDPRTSASAVYKAEKSLCEQFSQHVSPPPRPTQKCGPYVLGLHLLVKSCSFTTDVQIVVIHF